MDPNQIKEHLRFASELGVAGVSRDPAWRKRSPADTGARARIDAGVPAGDPEPVLTPPATPQGVRVLASLSQADALAAIKADIGPDCSRCKLHTLGRRQVVFGVGNPAADLMFVGEAPGADEDLQGIPFVGRAGQLLTKIIEAIGLTRDDVYIANVIKCRPPNNRDPEPDEVDTCKPFLMQQIQMIRPKLVCTLGNWATQTLLERKVGITKVKAQAFYMKDFVIFPLLHPAAALHQGNLLDTLKEDFKKLKDFLDRHTQQSAETESAAPAAPVLTIEPPNPAQMDLFG
jgi:uracil-DNA glycosylase family 4